MVSVLKVRIKNISEISWEAHTLPKEEKIFVPTCVENIRVKTNISYMKR
jgi:hypothetical protein